MIDLINRRYDFILLVNTNDQPQFWEEKYTNGVQFVQVKSSISKAISTLCEMADYLVAYYDTAYDYSRPCFVQVIKQITMDILELAHLSFVEATADIKRAFVEATADIKRAKDVFPNWSVYVFINLTYLKRLDNLVILPSLYFTKDGVVGNKTPGVCSFSDYLVAAVKRYLSVIIALDTPFCCHIDVN